MIEVDVVVGQRPPPLGCALEIACVTILSHDDWKGGLRLAPMSAQSAAQHRALLAERVALACEYRDEWMRHGLSVQPSDRSAAEAAVAELYRLVGARDPHFVWVPSPAAAKEACIDVATAEPRNGYSGTVSARIAGLLSSSRSRMDRRIRGGRPIRAHPSEIAPARRLSPVEALANGARRDVLLVSAIADPLHATLMNGVGALMRAAFPAAADETLGIAWYGQLEAYRVGYYDTIR